MKKLLLKLLGLKHCSLNKDVYFISSTCPYCAEVKLRKLSDALIEHYQETEELEEQQEILDEQGEE